MAILLPRPHYLTLFTVMLAAGNAVVSTSFIALQGMMSVSVPTAVFGKSAGWFQAGNVGSFPLYGGLALWLIERTTLAHAAAAMALASFLPSLVVLFVDEPPRSLAPSWVVFRSMFGEIKRVIGKRETWFGLFVFLSPVGLAGSFGLFSAIGVDYGVSPETVLWVTAVPGGVVASVTGCAVGGAISDWLPRRASYIVCGAAVSLAAAVMAIAPIAPGTFSVGVIVCEFVGATCASAVYAFTLELSGTEPMTAGTRMAIFGAVPGVAGSYMTWLSGRGYHAWGVRGGFGTDACVGLAAVAVVIVLLRTIRERPTTARPS